MDQQFIEEHEIKIEIEEIKVEEQEYACYNWVNDLELRDNKNWYTQFQPIVIEAKVNLKKSPSTCNALLDVCRNPWLLVESTVGPTVGAKLVEDV